MTLTPCAALTSFLSWCVRPRSTTLKTGFSQELQSRADAFAAVKTSLETLYSKKLGEEDLKANPGLLEEVQSALRNCDSAMTSYAGTLRSVKAAIDAWMFAASRATLAN